MKKIIKRIKGFTLTELIIVIAIIGILAAVLIPSITGYIKKANISADKQEVTNMNQAYQLYLSENDLMNADMEASDVRNIVLQTGDYSFKTRVKDYAIWYSNDSKKIYYGKVADGVEAAGGSGKLEDINQNGKLLISTGGSKAAEALYALRNLKSASEFTTLVNTAKAFTDAQKTYLTTNFSTDKVLYVGESNSIFTQKGSNIPSQVIFSDNVQVLSEGQITNVTKITKLSVPVSLLYLGAGAFKDITIDKIELKNPDTFIETGCFNSTTLSKNILIKEQDSATLSKSNIDCFVTLKNPTTGITEDKYYSYTTYTNGNMTCKYINFYGIQFNRTATGAKRCLVQSKINGNVIEYNYFELNGMGIVAKETFTYLREVVLTAHYKDVAVGGSYDPYVDKVIDGYQFKLPELSYKTSSNDVSTYTVKIKYGDSSITTIDKVTTPGSADFGKYVFTPTDFSKDTKYTLQVLYGTIVIYEMIFEKVASS